MIARPGDQCWQRGDNADPVNHKHGRADPSNAVQSHEELYTPAQRSETGCAPGRTASVNIIISIKTCKHAFDTCTFLKIIFQLNFKNAVYFYLSVSDDN